MNCEEYRQALAGDPSEAFDGGSAHAASCAGCRAWRDDLERLDARIAKALAIDVPPLRLPDLAPIGVGDRVVQLASGRRRRFAPPLWLGLAAGVVLAAALGLRLGGTGSGDVSLADEVIAHIHHEPDALRRVSTPVPDSSLQTALGERVEGMDSEMGLITYARSCVIRGRTVPHLVMQGARGPITLILMPDEHVGSAIPVHGDNLNGVILPVGNGSIAIVGEQDEPIEAVEQRVIDSVRWRT